MLREGPCPPGYVSALARSPLYLTSGLPRYAVATQDQALRAKLRTLAGVPILYLHNSAPTLEKPPEVSTERADREEADR